MLWWALARRSLRSRRGGGCCRERAGASSALGEHNAVPLSTYNAALRALRGSGSDVSVSRCGSLMVETPKQKTDNCTSVGMASAYSIPQLSVPSIAGSKSGVADEATRLPQLSRPAQQPDAVHLRNALRCKHAPCGNVPSRRLDSFTLSKRSVCTTSAFASVRQPLTRRWASGDAQTKVKLTVDGREVSVPAGATVLQACGAAGVDVPRFCYHARLAVAGNCRMCLVQVNGAPKLAASCALPAGDGMAVSTTAEAVLRAREGVMEMLLANHPLDCPICDQGGECDLQDQALAFGADRSRHVSTVGDAPWGGKRAVEDKDLGPLVATSMNRCIQCTRCVRFAVDLAGTPELGTAGRGGALEVGTYVRRTLASNLSGNLADLCPVGALTSRPYAFRARPWELYRTDSHDVLDGHGSAIRVDSRGAEVLRVLPRESADANEEWLADRSRYAVDALCVQRLAAPLVRRRLFDAHYGVQSGPDIDGDELVPVTWEQALCVLSRAAAQSKKPWGIVGAFADAESIHALQTYIGPGRVSFDRSAAVESAGGIAGDWLRALYLHTGIAAVERADAAVLVGTSLREEAPLLNLRLRRAWLNGCDRIAVVGPPPPADPTYGVSVLESDWTRLPALDVLRGARRPLILVGQSAVLDHAQGADVLRAVCALAKRHADALFASDWCGLSFVALDCARVSALALGAGPTPWERLPDADLLYLLNADDARLAQIDRGSRRVVVYQGHHADVGALRADVVLPGAAYTEKDASWTRMDGDLVRTRAAVGPPGDAREDWAVLRALAEACPLNVSYTAGERRALDNMRAWTTGDDARASMLAARRLADAATLRGLVLGARPLSVSGAQALRRALASYYQADCVSRNSATMAACVRAFGPHGGEPFVFRGCA